MPLFKGRQCKDSQRTLIIDGVTIHCSESVISIAWRKALRMLWGLHPMNHCDILAGLSNLKPLNVQLKYRFIGFLKKCLDHDNATVKNVALIALNNPMSCAGNNYRHILSKYQNVLNNMCV